MIVVGCSGGVHLASRIAKLLNARYVPLSVDSFPDGESHIRLDASLREEMIVLVQSFYGNINDKLIEVVFAAHTARLKKAKKVILVSPYFCYLRQDKEFHPGEAVSIHAIGDMLSPFLDHVMVMDPHMHREKRLDHIFHCKTTRLSANHLVASYIKKHIRRPLIIGPDGESYKWAQHIAEMIGCDFTILRKTRHSSTKVTIHFEKKIDPKTKNLVIIDDMISTGNTIIETVKALRKQGIHKITVFAVHGIFVKNALARFKQAKIPVLTTNTLPSPKAKIDISTLLSQELQKLNFR